MKACTSVVVVVSVCNADSVSLLIERQNLVVKL